MSDPACIFCRIVSRDALALTIYEDDATMAFMDINPATDGHCLVIPKRHAPDVWTLPEEDGVAVWRSVRRLAGAVRDALRADGLNILQSNGRAALQTVFHYHVHVIPRYVGDGIHVPLMRAPGDRSRLDEFADLIRAQLT
ncbi:MAG TPA: HIT family protein [Actinomycetota bacterium]